MMTTLLKGLSLELHHYYSHGVHSHPTKNDQRSLFLKIVHIRLSGLALNLIFQSEGIVHADAYLIYDMYRIHKVAFIFTMAVTSAVLSGYTLIPLMIYNRPLFFFIISFSNILFGKGTYITCSSRIST